MQAHSRMTSRYGMCISLGSGRVPGAVLLLLERAPKDEEGQEREHAPDPQPHPGPPSAPPQILVLSRLRPALPFMVYTAACLTVRHHGHPTASQWARGAPRLHDTHAPGQARHGRRLTIRPGNHKERSFTNTRNQDLEHDPPGSEGGMHPASPALLDLR
jgi:hypothetical protein